jgi:hypothetical protein
MAGEPLTTARELVRAATAAGAKFAVSGHKLSVTAPRPLAPELVRELRRSKVEILRLLATRDRPRPFAARRRGLVAPSFHDPDPPLGA